MWLLVSLYDCASSLKEDGCGIQTDKLSDRQLNSVLQSNAFGRSNKMHYAYAGWATDCAKRQLKGETYVRHAVN